MHDNVRDQESLEHRIRKAFAHEDPKANLATILNRAAQRLKASNQMGREVDSPAASSGSRAPITLLLADDHKVFAEGLGMVLDAEDDVEVLGVARDGEEALRLLDQHLPDVLLLDAHMPQTDLCEVLRAAKAKAPGTRVVVLSADARRETVNLAMEAGADGFLAKDLTGWQLAAAIRKLLEGQGAPVTPALPPQPVRDPSVELRVRTLSAREREILGLLVNGHSNRRIAEDCFLSLNTVRTHVQNVLVKLGVHSKLEAVAFALEHHVVPLGNRAPSHSSTKRLPRSTGESP
jgi:DNA-binding NarL/FixJ family response regulator